MLYDAKTGQPIVDETGKPDRIEDYETLAVVTIDDVDFAVVRGSSGQCDVVDPADNERLYRDAIGDPSELSAWVARWISDNA